MDERDRKAETSMVAASAAGTNEPVAQRAKLSKQQESLLNVLRDPKVLRMSISQICTKAGISRTTYYAALENETFLAHLDSAIQAYLKGAEFPVLHNVVKKASDPKTATHHWSQMVLRMRGRLDSDAQKPTQVQVNFGNVVRPKVEISPAGRVVIEGEVADADKD